jgi:hypothetical protein
MGKKFWCCTAVAVLAGMAWTVHYSYQHPTSPVGTMVVKACELGNRCNPIMLMGRGLSQYVKGTETAAYRDHNHGSEPVIPEDPTPVNEEPAPADEGKEIAGAIGLNENNFDLNENTRIPAPINIREEADPMPVNGEGPLGIKDPEPMNNPLPDVFGGVQQTGHAEVATQPINPCPPMMPYCDDEPCPTTEPSCEQGYPPQKEKCPCGTLARQVLFFWTGFLDQGTVTKSTCGSEECEVLPMPQEEEQEPPMEEQSQSQYHHYHERYSVCPYSGKCVPLDPPTAEPTPEAKPCDKDSQSPCDGPDKCKKSRKSGCQGTEDCPKHPEIDTMEYRPSDASFNEYGPGGPY